MYNLQINDEDGRREKRGTGGGRMGNKVGKFEDLEVWKEGMRLGGWMFGVWE